MNEYSTRYSVAIDSAAETAPSDWRLQAQSNRQGSAGTLQHWPAGMLLSGVDAAGAPVFALSLGDGCVRRFVWRAAGDARHAEFHGDKGALDFVVQGAAVIAAAKAAQASKTMDAFLADAPTHVTQAGSQIAWLDAATPGEYLSTVEKTGLTWARDAYEERLFFDIAREQARKDLPLSTYTEAYWKCDIRNIVHFLGLRMDAHAQKEIREFATVIGEQIVRPLFPVVWQAFLDYSLNALTLSALDIAVLSKLVMPHYSAGFVSPDEMLRVFRTMAVTEAMAPHIPPTWLLDKCRERDEFYAKLQRLNLAR